MLSVPLPSLRHPQCDQFVRDASLLREWRRCGARRADPRIKQPSVTGLAQFGVAKGFSNIGYSPGADSSEGLCHGS